MGRPSNFTRKGGVYHVNFQALGMSLYVNIAGHFTSNTKCRDISSQLPKGWNGRHDVEPT